MTKYIWVIKADGAWLQFERWQGGGTYQKAFPFASETKARAAHQKLPHSVRKTAEIKRLVVNPPKLWN